jgi:hypothetical protein
LVIFAAIRRQPATVKPNTNNNNDNGSSSNNNNNDYNQVITWTLTELGGGTVPLCYLILAAPFRVALHRSLYPTC